MKIIEVPPDVPPIVVTLVLLIGTTLVLLQNFRPWKLADSQRCFWGSADAAVAPAAGGVQPRSKTSLSGEKNLSLNNDTDDEFDMTDVVDVADVQMSGVTDAPVGTANTFDAVLKRDDLETPWGFAWQATASASAARLLIARIDPSSPAGRWSATRRLMALQPFERGDEILAANGATDFETIRQELNSARDQLHIRVAHSPTPVVEDSAVLLQRLRAKTSNPTSPCRHASSPDRQALSAPAVLPAFNCMVKNTFIEPCIQEDDEGSLATKCPRIAHSDPTPVAEVNALMQAAYTPGWYGLDASGSNAAAQASASSSSHMLYRVAEATPRDSGGEICGGRQADGEADGDNSMQSSEKQADPETNLSNIPNEGSDQVHSEGRGRTTLVGQWRRIEGLQQAVQYNGRWCLVKEFDLAMARYVVKLPEQQPDGQWSWINAKLKAESLQELTEDELLKAAGALFGNGAVQVPTEQFQCTSNAGKSDESPPISNPPPMLASPKSPFPPQSPVSPPGLVEAVPTATSDLPHRRKQPIPISIESGPGTMQQGSAVKPAQKPIQKQCSSETLQSAPLPGGAADAREDQEGQPARMGAGRARRLRRQRAEARKLAAAASAKSEEDVQPLLHVDPTAPWLIPTPTAFERSQVAVALATLDLQTPSFVSQARASMQPTPWC
eukprot:TRINITY_DN121536_c0_g1_i1.p1 TRINITY_DN121536_c0_g1~~TRINITY_DN121536_c0_g1_i1.p1  ORF type:complete len:669 (-),score=69.57 TRINITY_DN121536_c0_g1_i1:184-2190(-)